MKIGLHPIIVITAARAAYCHLAPLTPYVDPELKANQPHQSTNSPIQALTGFPSGNGSNPSEYRPNRGPNIIADANADEPPEQMSTDSLNQHQNLRSYLPIK